MSSKNGGTNTVTGDKIRPMIHEIYNIIKTHQVFLLTTHVRSDGDGIGSEIALFHALKEMGKSVCIVNDSLIPQIYKFIVPASGMYSYPDHPKNKAEVVISLDCPTLDRLGRTQEIIPKDAVIINLDHHISNENFGHINWVTEEMCATGEIVFNLLKETNVSITPDIATALYVAIITDTGRFTHTNTSPEALRAAASLIEHGARYQEITKHVYNTNPYNLIQLNACALNTIKLHSQNRISTLWLTREMLEKTGVNAIDTQEIAEIPASIDGVTIGVLFREMTQPNWVKISMRSRNGFDVNSIARKFGGGGHKYAAGCEIQGSISEVQKVILDELDKALPKK